MGCPSTILSRIGVGAHCRRHSMGVLLFFQLKKELAICKIVDNRVGLEGPCILMLVQTTSHILSQLPQKVKFSGDVSVFELYEQ